MRPVSSAVNTVVALASGLLIACGEPFVATAPPPETPEPPQFQIYDGAHSRGNPHVFFLPPAVPKPAYSGTFDPTLSPEVVICTYDEALGCTDVLAHYTTTSGTGGELVRRDAASEHYMVHWRTSRFDLVAGTTYRIYIVVEGTVLAHADVQVVNAAQDLKHIASQEQIALLDDRTLPIKFRIEKGAVFLVDAAGGSFTGANGKVSVLVPAGALDAPTAITVVPAQSVPSARSAILATSAFDFGPDGAQFAIPATIVIRTNAAALPSGMDPASLRLYTRVGDSWQVIDGSSADAAGTVTGSVSHFSAYGSGPPVKIVTVSPASGTVTAGAQRQLTAVVASQPGKPIGDRVVSWTSSDPAVATVVGGPPDANGDATGLVITRTVGQVTITATSEGIDGTAQLTVVPLALSTVSAGGFHSCGLATDGSAFCWGWNPHHALGTGNDVGSTTPVATAGGITFASVEVGAYHSCGITPRGDAYCWGTSMYGGLGNGLEGGVAYAPLPVAGGLSFTSLTLGSDHTCGIATSGAAYCWGVNGGQLGTGSPGIPFSYLSPVPVLGGLTWKNLSAGHYFTCGVAVDGSGYCWGYDNYNGVLGIASLVGTGVPQRIDGSVVFSTISAGGHHACGVAADGTAYCWGVADFGQLGNGVMRTVEQVPVRVPAPSPVAGGVRFGSIDAGSGHTCAVAIDGAAYCWGLNLGGRLGDGTTTWSSTPVAVAGGLRFSSVSAVSHTCGVTVDRAVYCWGENEHGKLGVGTTLPSSVPVRVTAPW